MCILIIYVYINGGIINVDSIKILYMCIYYMFYIIILSSGEYV